MASRDESAPADSQGPPSVGAASGRTSAGRSSRGRRNSSASPAARRDNGASPFPSSHGEFGSPNADAVTPRSVPGTTPGTGSRRSLPSGTPRSAFRDTPNAGGTGPRRNDLGGGRRVHRRVPSTGGTDRRRSRSASRPPGEEGGHESANEADDLGALSDSAPPSEIQQTYVWGTSVNVQECTSNFRRFIVNFKLNEWDDEPYYKEKLREMYQQQIKCLALDCQHLHSFNPELYRLMTVYPQEIIPMFDVVVNEIFQDEIVDGINDPGYSVQVRTFNLREAKAMRDLNPSDIDQMICVRGMVTRATQIIPELSQARFQCAACQHKLELQYIDNGRITEPAHCSNCSSAGTMTLVHNASKFTNKQQLRMQENPDSIPDGETPHTVSLSLFDELVDIAKPGDRVEVTGVYRAVSMRVAPNQRTLRSIYKTYIDVIHVRKDTKHRLRNEASDDVSAEVDGLAADPSQPAQNLNPLQGADPDAGFSPEREQQIKELAERPDIYDALVRALAPSIWELEDVKKGILCLLFGGVVKRFKKDGVGKGFRGDINVLLVGDPGVSKSQLLTYVHKIAPRGLYTSGRGSSAVGLTAYVTKDPETRETVLESGALVLSDRGVCCIDEFDKMSENARSTLHEVMEQQTVSVAKAGIIATLNARTSVLASANPVGSRYNPRMSVIDNIQLPPSLLSRFDLIYLVLDKADPQTDRRLARHLVALHYLVPPARASGGIDMSLLTDYISYARSHCHPELTDEAAALLVNGYVDMRRLGGSRKVITATPRQLESLIRLSEALARMRLDKRVTEEDVEEAMRLMKVAMQQAAWDPKTGQIDMDRIYTGVSASDRAQRHQIGEAVLELLKEKPGAAQSVTQIVAELKQRSGMPLTIQEVRDAVKEMGREGTVRFQNDSVTAA